ncbi:MAG: hypothetical protein M1334_00550 [Patescibacteria group bacterium]|nr:hypothetical protein [Patescibacteria group bacterium]
MSIVKKGAARTNPVPKKLPDASRYFKKEEPISRIKKLENGYRVYYMTVNTHFNESDSGESYLEPMERHVDCLYEKITGHYLICLIEYYGLDKHERHLAIIDDASRKTVLKRCMEEIKKNFF